MELQDMKYDKALHRFNIFVKVTATFMSANKGNQNCDSAVPDICELFQESDLILVSVVKSLN